MRRRPTKRGARTAYVRHRVVRQVASWCLSYPDDVLREQVPVLRSALAEHDIDDLTPFLDHLDHGTLEERQREYVDVFDLSRKHALYVSYWTDGDTRRRGEVLASFKQRYRDSGFAVDTQGELPDFLPLVLEFAAIADPDAGEALLREYRPSLELLRIGLVEDDSPYAGVVAAVCATLPGASPKDRAAVQAMADGPPTETVGLEPYLGVDDPRLLPMAGLVAADQGVGGR